MYAALNVPILKKLLKTIVIFAGPYEELSMVILKQKTYTAMSEFIIILT